MYQGGASCSTQENPSDKECNVEHCFFPWKIDNFWDSATGSSNYPVTLFPASENDESYTLWNLALRMSGFQNEIVVELSRLKSRNTSLVFVRFRWEILDRDGNRVLPGSIHAVAHTNDVLTKTFLRHSSLLEDQGCVFDDGCFHVLCEMSVYGRTLEERISSCIRGDVPYGLCVLSEDMERLFLKGTAADLWITTMDGAIQCHKSILSARSEMFRQLLRARHPGDHHLDLSGLRTDVLHAIILYLYTGNIDMYLKHTIPNGLYYEAKNHGLHPLQRHLECVNSNDFTRFKSVEVIWKLPRFHTLVLEPNVVLYCPNSSTLYDDRWCFKLEFNNSREDVRISVIRRQDERSTHFVKIVVQVQTFHETSFERTMYLSFVRDGEQGMNKFLTKGELSRMVSVNDTLVLKCSLLVLGYKRFSQQSQCTSSLSSVNQFFRINTAKSLQQLSKDLLNLFHRGHLSDTFVGVVSYHSYIAETRFLTPEIYFKAFLVNLQPSLVQHFFRFLYGGQLYQGNDILSEICIANVPKIKTKLLEHLVLNTRH